MSELVGARRRVKRKRRKPPGPLFWLTLFMVVLLLSLIGESFYFLVTPGLGHFGTAVYLLSVGACGVALNFFWWPALKYQVRLWKADNDE